MCKELNFDEPEKLSQKERLDNELNEKPEDNKRKAKKSLWADMSMFDFRDQIKDLSPRYVGMLVQEYYDTIKEEGLPVPDSFIPSKKGE